MHTCIANSTGFGYLYLTVNTHSISFKAFAIEELGEAQITEFVFCTKKKTLTEKEKMPSF